MRGLWSDIERAQGQNAVPEHGELMRVSDDIAAVRATVVCLGMREGPVSESQHGQQLLQEVPLGNLPAGHS